MMMDAHPLTDHPPVPGPPLPPHHEVLVILDGGLDTLDGLAEVANADLVIAVRPGAPGSRPARATVLKDRLRPTPYDAKVVRGHRP